MAYDLNAIRAKLSNIANKNNKGFNKDDADKPRLKYWKPTEGNTDIRILPYNDGAGQPAQELLYYDSKLLSEKRFVAPFQFGMEDPINDMLTNLSTGPRLEKEVFKTLMQFKAKPSYYFPVIVRHREDEGVMFWELNEKNLQKVYASTFAHPDYEDEQLTDLDKGYDLTVTGTDAGKKYNGNTVIEWSISPRKKPSKLLKTTEAALLLVESVPNVKDFFRQYVRGEGKIKEMLEIALAGGDSGNTATDSEGSSRDLAEDSSDLKVSASRKQAMDDAFADF